VLNNVPVAAHTRGMNTQNQIKRTLSQPAAIAYVAGVLHAHAYVHRSALAAVLCEHFGFYDVRGHKQRDGCLKALRELEAAGHFTLPAARGKRGSNTPKRLPEAVADPTGVPAKAGEVRGLELIRVRSEAHMRIWNEMMIREHPRGHGPLVGRQMRYLVSSAYGWLGALGFASALHLAERDRWIGWDVEQRRAALHTVVNLSRFLIRPSVHCANLASRLLAWPCSGCPTTSRTASTTGRGSWRVLRIAPGSWAPVIRPPTGSGWAGPKAGADRIVFGRRRKRPKTSICIRWRKTSDLNWGWRRMSAGAP
jgi:hypothetical protein